MIAFLAFLSFLLNYSHVLSSTVSHDYDNPVFPDALPLLPAADQFYKKHIPRRLWVAVKDRKDDIPGTLKNFFTRNANWNITVCDNLCKDAFMAKVYAGTSTLWAYNTLNPELGAARADLWRYSVLYTYGGVYLDDDSDIKKPLDEIIQDEDRLLMSEEGSSSLGDCYNPNYHLSDVATFAAHTNYTSALHFDGIGKENVPTFFHDHTLVNWGIFIAPRHPIMERTIRNVVEILRSEYLRRSVLHMTRWDQKWKALICSTGFVLTYSTREIELENTIPASWMPKISVSNYREHGGNVKAISTGADPDHWMKKMNRLNTPLLREYATVSLADILDHLDGKTVMGDAGREVFLIFNGTKRSFGDYDTFLGLGFTDKTTKHMVDAQLQKVPAGPMVTMADGPAIKALVAMKHAQPAVWKHGHGHANGHGHNGHAHNGHGHGHVTPTVATTPSVPAAAVGDSVPVTPPATTSTVTNTIVGPPAPAPTFTTAIVKPPEYVIPGSSSSGPAAPVQESAETVKIRRFLEDATAKLNNQTVLCFGDDYAGTRDDYLNNVHKAVIGDAVPVMAYPFCARTFQLGNTIGYYLNDLACADISGSHFITVHKEFKLLDPDALVTQGRDKLAFFDVLPDLVVNPAAKPPAEVRAAMRGECTCLQYCWEHSKAPWLRRIELVQNTMLRSINHYVDVAKGHELGTVLNTTDMATVPLTTRLPLLPNVTIQYRCGDNIGFGKTHYGLLPFSAFGPHRISPAVAKYIYVIADSPNRSVGHVYNGRCETILQHLFERLKKNFPSAVVIVKRGGDLFLDYARIAHSQVVICSASTFCFWPSLANVHGQVHFPLTPLIANAKDNSTAPDIKPNFHWIREVEMIKNFKNYRPWTALIDDLEKL